MSTVPWRPQVLWCPMGGLLGAFSGAVVGIALLLGSTIVSWWTSTDRGFPWSELATAVMAGGWFGGIGGLVVGLFVGVELMFLVGAHLPRDVARRRAYVLGHVLPPVTMVAPFVLAGAVSLSMPDSGAWWGLMALFGGSVMGGPLARWLASFEPPRPDAS